MVMSCVHQTRDVDGDGWGDSACAESGRNTLRMPWVSHLRGKNEANVEGMNMID